MRNGQQVARRLLIIISISLPIIILADIYGPGAQQQRGMREARQFQESIAPKLAADPRFSAVESGVMTHPSLRFYGEVPDERALHDLNELTTPPPAARFFTSYGGVKVTPQPSTRPGSIANDRGSP